MKSYKITASIIITVALLTIPFLAYSNPMKLESEEMAQKFIETEKAKNEWYDFCLLSELNNQEYPKQGILYVGLVKGVIKYKVLGKDNEINEGTITADDLGGNLTVPTSNELFQFKLIKNTILKITSNRGHTKNNKGSNIGRDRKIIPMPEGGISYQDQEDEKSE